AGHRSSEGTGPVPNPPPSTASLPRPAQSLVCAAHLDRPAHSGLIAPVDRAGRSWPVGPRSVDVAVEPPDDRVGTEALPRVHRPGQPIGDAPDRRRVEAEAQVAAADLDVLVQ